MTRLFGTDGIRGAANLDLRPSLAFALGRATAHQVGGPGRSIVLGQDTRRSGDMFVAAITAGATSMGTDVHSVGVVPTPALAFLAGSGEFGAGIMVSASHNPAEDNGLKVLDPSGLKLDDDLEDELESLILRADELPGAPPSAIGVARHAGELLERYVGHRTALAETIPARGLHVVLDAANGAAYRVAPRILAATGARVTVIHDAPDGDNINRDCGATHPESLMAAVRDVGGGRRVRARRRRGPVRRGGRRRAARGRRPGAGHPRARAARARRARPRQPRGVGPVERRAPARGRGRRRAAGAHARGRQAHPRRDARLRRRPGRREERPRDRPRARHARATGS